MTHAPEITIDPITDHTCNVLLNGDKVGEVTRGVNGEWYPVPLSRIAHAYPLDGLDNVAGTGERTPEQAATYFQPIRNGHDFDLYIDVYGQVWECRRCDHQSDEMAVHVDPAFDIINHMAGTHRLGRHRAIYFG
jgi:hypothetical protein